LWTRMLAPPRSATARLFSERRRPGREAFHILGTETASAAGARGIARPATGVPHVVLRTVSRTLRTVTPCGTGPRFQEERQRPPGDASAPVACSITPHSAEETPPPSDQSESDPAARALGCHRAQPSGRKGHVACPHDLLARARKTARQPKRWHLRGLSREHVAHPRLACLRNLAALRVVETFSAPSPGARSGR
jgi:hypothetical protein